MELKSFEGLLNGRNGVRVSDDLVIWNKTKHRGYLLWNDKTDEEKEFSSFGSLIEDNPQVRSLIEERDDFTPSLDGGRGAGSLSGRMGGGFTNARGAGSGRIGFAKPLYPASFNAVNSTSKTLEGTIKQFADKYKGANHEYGITVGESGFVTRHVEGEAHSVAISGGKGEMVVHNHPGGGNFSKADLQSTAMESSRGIVAVGNEKTYTLEKGSKFDATGFARAVGRAKWPVEYDYDKGADWWLRRNAKTFGYTYSARATK